MNKKFVKWQLKAWLIPLIIIGVYGLLAIVLPRLTENYVVYNPDFPEYVINKSISSAVSGFSNTAISTGVFLSLVLSIISADYKWKGNRYDAYAQLPLGKNGIKRHRMILSLALVAAMFTVHYWLGAGTFALRWASLNQVAAETGGRIGGVDFLPILWSYLLVLPGMAMVHLINFAIGSMSHSLWSALTMMLLGNLVIALGPVFVLRFLLPYCGITSGNAYSYGAILSLDFVYRVSQIFADKAAYFERVVQLPVLIALVVGGIGTLALGIGSFFYVFFRKEMSGEYCGGKDFDSFGKTLFPHAVAFAVAFALGNLGLNVHITALTNNLGLAILTLVFVLLGYFILLLVYFLTLRLDKKQWIIAGSIVALAIILFVIGTCVTPLYAPGYAA